MSNVQIDIEILRSALSHLKEKRAAEPYQENDNGLRDTIDAIELKLQKAEHRKTYSSLIQANGTTNEEKQIEVRSKYLDEKRKLLT